MSARLDASPRKKRAPSSDDDSVTTPKKLRTAALLTSSAKSVFSPSTPILARTPTSPSKSSSGPPLPPHLGRMRSIYASLQHALSVALASSAVGPSHDTGRVPNVLTHLSLTAATGFSVSCDVTDIRRLCWLVEWDGIRLPEPAPSATSRPSCGPADDDDEENPFLVRPVAPPRGDWTRGGMGLIFTPATHFWRTEGKRTAAYGIGIEVEMDLAEGKGGGMAAVARWTAEGEARKRTLEAKLRAWMELNTTEPVPALPLANLPALATVSKRPSIPSLFAKCGGGASPSPSKARQGSAHPIEATRTPKEFAIPFPLTPQTPRTSPFKLPTLSGSATPRKDSKAVWVPQTPTTSRRAALYERVRQKSLTSTPSCKEQPDKDGPTTKEKMRMVAQEDLRRRCLLGRLEEVAATVWSLFSAPAQSPSTPLSVSRKRRTIQTQEVVRALVASSSVPISPSDAQDSITMLMNLCPFFLRPLVIAGVDWLEMPASSPKSVGTPPSPRGKEDSANEVLNRSPKTVKREQGGLREVRQRIRREIELDEY